VQAAHELIDSRRLGRAGAAHEDGLADEQWVAEDFESGVAQRRAGRDHVGNHVGHFEPHGRLDGAVEADHPSLDALSGEMGRHDAGVSGGDT
jgi:hypothetical protein